MNAKQKLEHAASLLDYDPESGALTWKEYRGGRAIAGDRAGCANTRGYRRIGFRVNGKKFTLLEHRIAYFVAHGKAPPQLDHINGVPDDNRIANLRNCTRSQNSHNSAVCKNNTSGIKGVCWNKRKRKWVAQIMINGKNKHLGYFDSLEEAEAVVKAKREKLHGEFANHG